MRLKTNETTNDEYLLDRWHLSGVLIVHFTLGLCPLFGVGGGGEEEGLGSGVRASSTYLLAWKKFSVNP